MLIVASDRAHSGVYTRLNIILRGGLSTYGEPLHAAAPLYPIKLSASTRVTHRQADERAVGGQIISHPTRDVITYTTITQK